MYLSLYMDTRQDEGEDKDKDKSDSNSDSEDKDELKVLEIPNARDHHIGGYFAASNQNESTTSATNTTINKTYSLAPPVSKHIATSLLLAKYNQVLDTHVKFVETAPLGNEGLDNTNDFFDRQLLQCCVYEERQWAWRQKDPSSSRK